MNIPLVSVPQIVSGSKGGAGKVPSNMVPITDIAPAVREGETLWMSIGSDYRIQLKGTPKRIIGDQILPEQPRVAQFVGHSFSSSDPETNRQLEAASARGIDFWKVSDIKEKAKEQQTAEAVRMVEQVVASGDADAMERLSVVLGAKGFSIAPREQAAK